MNKTASLHSPTLNALTSVLSILGTFSSLLSDSDGEFQVKIFGTSLSVSMGTNPDGRTITLHFSGLDPATVTALAAPKKEA